jgi:hypothetical protein
MTLRRWLALGGIASALFFIVSFVTGGNEPNDHASAARVISFYRDHRGANIVSALAGALASVLLVLFAVRLRELLQGGDRNDSLLPNAAFGGALILAVAVLGAASITFALVRAGHYRLPGPAQTLNLLSQDSIFVLAGGLSVLFLATGIATVRKPVLPRWLGWVAIVIGVLAIAGPLVLLAAPLSVLWLLVVTILVSTRKDLRDIDVPETTMA